ncbi:CBASS cGAMP-activated phospholipase [Rubellimicrobium arenae]|uniref:CBASS cGAMP-activated phospholipase n=1 Tax=Rubellimicrobium arenae TaxID=2817372 RepID=UPI001B305E93|nr:CBASS cGAMP-activated phospholipase [Rubellimicrobium arenae]
MPGLGRLGPGEARSWGAIPNRRVPQAWPKDRRFRILSLDGGGIRGVFPATILAELERRYTNGRAIGDYFDLVAGTSTGGILGLGLGAGLTGRDLQNLYVERGFEVFPSLPRGLCGRLKGIWRNGLHYLRYRYDQTALEALLMDRLGARRLLGSSKVRLVVPAFEGRHSEVFVFKTPHHPDYKTDRHVPMVTVGLATAAAPAFFRPLERGGYLLVDGGVWANNPVMLAVIEALTCFTVEPTQIDVLTIGCGNDPYVVSSKQIQLGGLFFWKDAIFAAMRLQSLAATNQARLLLGPPNVMRLDAPTNEKQIALDDWRRSVEELVPEAVKCVATKGDMIAAQFLFTPAQPYTPCPE